MLTPAGSLQNKGFVLMSKSKKAAGLCAHRQCEPRQVPGRIVTYISGFVSPGLGFSVTVSQSSTTPEMEL